MAAEIFPGDAVFCVAIGCLAGTLAAGLDWNVFSVVFAAVFAGAGFVWLSEAIDFRARIIFAALFFSATLAGSFYYFFWTDLHARTENFDFGKMSYFSAVISGEPTTSDNYILAAAALEKPLAGTITIFAPLDGVFHYGDEVNIEGIIEAPKNRSDDPAVFPKYIKVVARNRGFWLYAYSIDFKAGILEKFNEVLPGDMAALLGGETLGGTTGMSAELKDRMSASGTSYVVSMYGYKISVIIGCLEVLFAGLLARRGRFFCYIVIIILFVLLSGGNISAVRAGIMTMLAIVAKMSGRLSDSRNALTLTAFAMTVYDPTLPTQSAFILSFLSIAGMAYLAAPLKQLFGLKKRDSGTNPGFFDWREAIIVAVASLLPIIPIIAVAFNDFSLAAFPSNVLIFPAVLPTMVIGIILAPAGFISSYLAFLVAKFAAILMVYQLAIIQFFSVTAIPLPSIFNSNIAFAAYYGLLCWFIYQHRVKNFNVRA